MTIKIRLGKEEAEEILEVYKSGGDLLPYTDIKEIKQAMKGNKNGKISLIVVEIGGRIVGALK